MTAPILHVPANIISGFLGVGKTSAILDLFRQKPAEEKWAVLVNEFGKIGIDGQIYTSNGIAVKEIPGGCMCCAQGLPLQVAVNRLLRETRPDRLIIESSGVGHPAGVLRTLKSEGFDKVLKIRAGICLVDPENLIDERYQDNDLFREQIQLADILVANKTDLATAEALQAFQRLSESLKSSKQMIAMTSNGRLSLDWLQYHHQPTVETFIFRQILEQPTEKWQTHSFRYDESTRFDLGSLKRWLDDIDAVRLKGIIRAADGYYLLNRSSSQSTITELSQALTPPTYNYLEVIDDKPDTEKLERGLSACIDKL